MSLVTQSVLDEEEEEAYRAKRASVKALRRIRCHPQTETQHIDFGESIFRFSLDSLEEYVVAVTSTLKLKVAHRSGQFIPVDMSAFDGQDISVYPCVWHPSNQSFLARITIKLKDPEPKRVYAYFVPSFRQEQQNDSSSSDLQPSLPSIEKFVLAHTPTEMKAINEEFDPQGSRIVITFTSYSTCVYSFPDYAFLFSLTPSACYGVRYSHDGTKIATGDSQGMIRVHNATSGMILGVVEVPRQQNGACRVVTRIEWSGNDSYIVAIVADAVNNSSPDLHVYRCKTIKSTTPERPQGSSSSFSSSSGDSIQLTLVGRIDGLNASTIVSCHPNDRYCSVMGNGFLLVDLFDCTIVDSNMNLSSISLFSKLRKEVYSLNYNGTCLVTMAVDDTPQTHDADLNTEEHIAIRKGSLIRMDASGSKKQCLLTSPEEINHVIVHPCGWLIAAAARGGRIHIYDLANNRALPTIQADELIATRYPSESKHDEPVQGSTDSSNPPKITTTRETCQGDLIYSICWHPTERFTLFFRLVGYMPKKLIAEFKSPEENAIPNDVEEKGGNGEGRRKNVKDTAATNVEARETMKQAVGRIEKFRVALINDTGFSANALSINPQGNMLCISNRGLWLYRYPSGHFAGRICSIENEPHEFIIEIEWSSSGRFVASVGRDGVRIADSYTGKVTGVKFLLRKQVSETNKKSGTTTSSSETSSSSSSSSSSSPTTSVDPERSETTEVQPIASPNVNDWHSLTSVKWCNNDTNIITASDDKTVRMWKVTSKGVLLLERVLLLPIVDPLSITVHPSNKWVVASGALATIIDTKVWHVIAQLNIFGRRVAFGTTTQKLYFSGDLEQKLLMAIDATVTP